MIITDSYIVDIMLFGWAILGVVCIASHALGWNDE